VLIVVVVLVGLCSKLKVLVRTGLSNKGAVVKVKKLRGWTQAQVG